jgi:GDPmannose 4,6-dehydratase
MKIIITGALGQDGTILTDLLQDNHELYGIIKINSDKLILHKNRNANKIKLISCDLSDIISVENLIKKINPEIIINFAGETDVINPWGDISKTYEQNFVIPANILTSISKYNKEIFFFQSSSSLMYGRSKDTIINEESKPSPMYPYGIVKLSTHHLLNEFRIKYDIRCSSGIFFNHESVYRNEKFITKKLSKLVSSILKGEKKKLELFDLNYNRDISHAEDFMNGVKLIIENKINDNFVFSSGISTNMLEFSQKFFSLHNLIFDDYINYKDSGIYDNYDLIGDNTKLKSLGWTPRYGIDELIKNVVEEELIK